MNNLTKKELIGIVEKQGNQIDELMEAVNRLTQLSEQLVQAQGPAQAGIVGDTPNSKTGETPYDKGYRSKMDKPEKKNDWKKKIAGVLLATTLFGMAGFGGHKLAQKKYDNKGPIQSSIEQSADGKLAQDVQEEIKDQKNKVNEVKEENKIQTVREPILRGEGFNSFIKRMEKKGYVIPNELRKEIWSQMVAKNETGLKLGDAIISFEIIKTEVKNNTNGMTCVGDAKNNTCGTTQILEQKVVKGLCLGTYHYVYHPKTNIVTKKLVKKHVDSVHKKHHHKKHHHKHKKEHKKEEKKNDNYGENNAGDNRNFGGGDKNDDNRNFGGGDENKNDGYGNNDKSIHNQTNNSHNSNRGFGGSN